MTPQPTAAAQTAGPAHRFQPLVGTSVSLTQLVGLRHHAEFLREFARRPSTGDLSGARLTRLRGRGVDFAEVRTYQPGDDVRSIDWRVTARTGRVHTKIFREERERPALLFIDQGSPTWFGSRVRLKSVAIAELAALLTWAILANGDRIGALVHSCNAEPRLFRPARARRAMLRILADVTRANTALPGSGDSPTRLSAALRELHRIRRPGNQVFVISDFSQLDADGERELADIARDTELVLLRVSDRLDAELPPPDLYAVRHGDVLRQIDTADRQLRRSFADAWQARNERLAAVARKARAPLLHLDTADNPLDVLISHAGHARGGRV